MGPEHPAPADQGRSVSTIDYITPETARQQRWRLQWKRPAWLTWKRAVIALLVGAAIAASIHWQLTRQKDWEIRVARLDGEDVAIATGMQVRKLLVKLPKGQWNLSMRWEAYANGSLKPIRTFGDVSTTVTGGDVTPMWIFIEDEGAGQARFTIGGASLSFNADPFGRFATGRPDGSMWQVPSGPITPGTTIFLYGRKWADPVQNPGTTMSVSLSSWPGSPDDMLILSLMITPPGAPPAPAAPVTTQTGTDAE